MLNEKATHLGIGFGPGLAPLLVGSARLLRTFLDCRHAERASLLLTPIYAPNQTVLRARSRLILILSLTPFVPLGL